MANQRTVYVLVVLAVVSFGCNRSKDSSVPQTASEAVNAAEQPLIVRATESPTDADSREPELNATPDGRIVLSWVEKMGEKRYALRMATRDQAGWNDPRTVAQGENWFVNWADFPSVIALKDGSLAVVYLFIRDVIVFRLTKRHRIFELMVRRIHTHKPMWPLLSAVVILALSSNTIILVACPHLGHSRTCLSDPATKKGGVKHEGTEQVNCHDMQSSDMDVQAMPMDMSNMDMEDAATSESKTYGSLNAEPITKASIERVNAAVITQSTETCAECVMHSRSDASSPSPAVALSNASLQSSAADSTVDLETALSSIISFVDIHDHGPPGSSSPRYVLNKIFRI